MRNKSDLRAPAPTPRQVVSVPQRPHASGPVPTRAVGAFVPRLTRKAFEKYGFSAASLLTDWATIVGADLARYTEPERLKWPNGVGVHDETSDDAQGRPGATLMLRVDPQRALEVQYKGQQIIERINAYFGYRAVAALRMLQAPVRPAAQARPAPVKSAPPIAPELETVSDAALRSALQRMAHGIVIRRSF
jgi:hypothetical protein